MHDVMTAPITAMISAEQRAHYETEGWLHLPQLMSSSTLQALLTSTARLQAQSSTFVKDTNVAGVFFEVQSASGRKRETAVAPGLLRKITNPSRAEASFMALRKDLQLLDIARAIGLKTPRCVVDQLTLKPAHVGTGFPFHQDAAFLHGDARAEVSTHGGVHVVIALDHATADNGGFEVLGRTHTSGLAPHTSYDTSSRSANVFDETHHALVPMAPGDAVLFHPLLAHGSGPNRSSTDRRLVTLWFVGGTVITKV